MSRVSIASGLVFLVSGFGGLIFELDALFLICALSVPVLLVALIVDACHRRYWALAPLALLVAALTFFVYLVSSVDIPVGG